MIEDYILLFAFFDITVMLLIQEVKLNIAKSADNTNSASYLS